MNRTIESLDLANNFRFLKTKKINFLGSSAERNQLKNNLQTYYLNDMDRGGLSTLKNLGNTCFLNAVIQCLSHTKPLTQYVFQGDYHGKADRLFLEYSHLIKEMWKENSIISPVNFFQIFCLHFKKNNHEQEDAHEVLLFLLDRFHEDLKFSVVFQDVNHHSLINKSLQALAKTQMSPINSLFMGQFHQRVQCSQCKHIDHSFPTFLNLMLPLPQPQNRKEYVNLYDLLNEFCHKEQVTRNCDHCGAKNIEGYKKTTFWRLPQILVIQLKRFNDYGGKNNHPIDYPLTDFDITRYSTYPNSSKQLYQLYGVVCHLGILQLGHYFSIVQARGRWVLFNDHKGQVLEEDNVITNHAYLLFYHR